MLCSAVAAGAWMLDVFVGTVAKRSTASRFATTHPVGLLFRDFYFLWGKSFAFVRAIAEGLIAAFAAGAPPVGSRFQLNAVGGFGGYNWFLFFGHELSF